MTGGWEDLTVAKKIVLHLSNSSRFEHELSCPASMTQHGIAESLGISRGHVAVELKRMQLRGQVKSKRAHVLKARINMKVYILTHLGERLAMALKEEAASSRYVVPKENGGLVRADDDVSAGARAAGA